MDEVFAIYSLIYCVSLSCFIFKTNEFASAGLTIEYLFRSFLGSESDDFIKYHMKRICLTLVVHASALAGYLAGLYILDLYSDFILLVGWTVWLYLWYFGITLTSLAIIISVFWCSQNWNNHPVVKNLKRFANDYDNNWCNVAAEINNEMKGMQKVSAHCGSRMKIIVTTNWIVAVNMYSVQFANQNDTELVVNNADTYDIARTGFTSDAVHGSINSAPVIQYLSIKVNCIRNQSPFSIRIYGLDFKDIKDQLRCPTIIPENVVFYQTKAEQFLEIFRETVKNNPIYVETRTLEPCCGCLTAISNVKLQKCCSDDVEVHNNNNEEVHVPTCISCRCKPMWCLDCVGRWFASRQDQYVTERWLSSKCTCPVCRSTFCILDVCCVVPSD